MKTKILILIFAFTGATAMHTRGWRWSVTSALSV